MGIKQVNKDPLFMQAALDQAVLAAQSDEVPIGAVVVLDGEIIAQAHNQVITLNDPTAHAEVLALRRAGQRVGNYRLVECELYVTLEPCSMCAGACVHARIKRLVYGARDLKTGVVDSVDRAFAHAFHNHKVDSTAGVLAVACGTVISDFFKQKRITKKANSSNK